MDIKGVPLCDKDECRFMLYYKIEEELKE